MKRVCEICGRSNDRTNYKDEFDMILCDSCLIMCKKHKLHYIPPNGEIHYDSEGNVICHVCGRSFKKLTEHIKFKHGMDKEAYKEKFELNRNCKLTGKNFIPNIMNDITEYSEKTRFKEGHKNSKKTRRLQSIKNRTGMKYKKQGDI